MAENKQCNICGRDPVCIDTFRVLDSCRDKDCFEDVRVFLTPYGQDIIDRTAAVRAKSAHIVRSYIDIDTVPFNRGFYQLTIRIYVWIVCEACVSPGNVQEIHGIAVVEKKVILFGSEGNVSIFKSDSRDCGFCPDPHDPRCRSNRSSNLPIAVFEAVDPIILASKIVEPHDPCICCCCCCGDIPEAVSSMIDGDLDDPDDCNRLVVTLGLFSVVRIERPAQFVISATEYSVPDKICPPDHDEDPCHMFHKMAFPTNEFSPPGAGVFREDRSDRHCGCGQ